MDGLDACQGWGAAVQLATAGTRERRVALTYLNLFTQVGILATL